MATIPLLTALALIAALACGIRWPGVLLAGCLFTYQASSLAQIGWLGEAYVAAAAFITLARFAKAGEKTSLQPVDGALILLVLWAGLSTAYTPYPNDAFFYFLRLMLSVASMYAVARFTSAENPDRLMAQFLIGLTALGGFLAFLLASVDRTGMYRLKLEDTTSVGLAQPLPYVAVAAALLFLLSRRLWVQALSVAAMGAVLYTSVLSGTRSVFLSAAFALLIALPMIWRRFPLRTTGKVGIVVVTAIVIAPLFFSDQLEPALERLTMNFTGGGLDLSDASSVERRAAYDSAFAMFYESPLIGHGHGSFAQLTMFSYPHNMFLEAGSEMGLIGLVLVTLWLAVLGKAVLQTDRPTAGLILATIGVVAFVQMQVSFSLFMARPLFLLTALVAAFAAGAAQRSRSDGMRQARPAAYPRAIATPDGSFRNS